MIKTSKKMGKRLHVQKKHVIEYADREFFNWKMEEFNDLLSELDVQVYGLDDYGYGDDIEICREHLERAIGILKKMELDENIQTITWDNGEDYDDTEVDCNEVRQRIISLYGIDPLKDDVKEYITKCISDLEYLRDNSDQNNYYIHMDWL